MPAEDRGRSVKAALESPEGGIASMRACELRHRWQGIALPGRNTATTSAMSAYPFCAPRLDALRRLIPGVVDQRAAPATPMIDHAALRTRRLEELSMGLARDETMFQNVSAPPWLTSKRSTARGLGRQSLAVSDSSPKTYPAAHSWSSASRRLPSRHSMAK